MAYIIKNIQTLRDNEGVEFKHISYYQYTQLGLFNSFGPKETAKQFDFRFEAQTVIKKLSSKRNKIEKL